MPNQTEDRNIRLEATVTPVEEGVPVFFGTFDPDDLSSYETDGDGCDNLDESMPLGCLSLAPGYSFAPGDPVLDAHGNRIGMGVLADSQGLAAADLVFTTHCSGDNYIVHANPCTGPDQGDVSTAPMVAWKRVYVEEDFMYRDGSDLLGDFTADGDGDDDTLLLTDPAYVAVNDTIIVFDADHPSGEIRTVLTKVGDAITVADLTNSYIAGYGDPASRGAAIVKPGTDTFDGLFVGDGSLNGNAYGVETDGTDGGCFVEFVALPDGSGEVPYREGLENLWSDYSTVWFQNRGKANYIHGIGAAYSKLTDDVVGLTNAAANWSYVFVRRIERMQFAQALLAVADTAAHELGHRFNIDPSDLDHSDVPAHDGTDDCVMTYTAGWEDGIAEFCAEIVPGAGDDGCIYDVRLAPEGL